MGHEDGPGLWTDRFLELFNIGLVGAELNVDEDRHEPVLYDRVDRGWEACGERDDFVAIYQTTILVTWRGEGAECQEIRRRSRVREHGMPYAHDLGKLALELLSEGAAGQPEVQSRLDK